MEVSFVPMEGVSDKYGEITLNETKKISESKSYTRFQENDLLWARITPCMENGKSAIAQNLQNGLGLGSTEFIVFRANSDDLTIDYLYLLLRTKLIRRAAVLFFSGSSGHQRVSAEFFKELMIPLPPANIQKSIVQRVKQIKTTASNLEDQAVEDVDNAKQEIEKVPLGESQ